MQNAQTLRPGIFFTSNTAMATIPFQGGTLCFFPPLKRLFQTGSMLRLRLN